MTDKLSNIFELLRSSKKIASSSDAKDKREKNLADINEKVVYKAVYTEAEKEVIREAVRAFSSFYQKRVLLDKLNKQSLADIQLTYSKNSKAIIEAVEKNLFLTAFKLYANK